MSHLPFTLLAYFFNATAVTIDKLLLTKHIPNPLVYIFYFSAFSGLTLFLLPFARVPSFEVFAIASSSTILWTVGAYFMFKGLQIGSVSRVIPIIGTLIPIILLSHAIFAQTISQQEITAVFLLILGIIALTILDWKGKISRYEVLFEVLSAAFFAVSYLILKQAYIRADFFTVLVWSRFIILPISIFVLLIPAFKKMVFSAQDNKPSFNILSKVGLLFLTAQAAGGLSELLLTFSISLASPALVNSLQGTQYIFLLIFSLFIFKEKFTRLALLSKLAGIALIGTGLYLLTSPL